MGAGHAGGWRRWTRFGRGDRGPEATGAASRAVALPRPDPPSQEALPEADRAAVRHVLDVLRTAGVLAGPPPDPAALYPALADEGPPVTVDGVLSALWEAAAVHRDVHPEDRTRNLVRHDTQVEQFADTLEGQVADLARLTAGALAVGLERIELTPTAGGLRTRAGLTIDGAAHPLDYHGHPKRLSTVIHVEVARALRAAGAPRRLAWLWSDQGPWITALTTDVAELNARLGLDPGDPDCLAWWTWIDEEAPLAAGDTTG